MPVVDRQSTPPGSAWPDCPPLEEVYAAARRAFPEIRSVAGCSAISPSSTANAAGPAARLRHPCDHPIVHAARRSVMETLEALPHITRSTRAIIGALPYRIGPSTIAMRQNPYGARTIPNPGGERVAMADAIRASAGGSPPPGPRAMPRRRARRGRRSGCRPPSSGRAGCSRKTGRCCPSVRWCAISPDLRGRRCWPPGHWSRGGSRRWR